jgi:hypothetical protein
MCNNKVKNSDGNIFRVLGDEKRKEKNGRRGRPGHSFDIEALVVGKQLFISLILTRKTTTTTRPPVAVEHTTTTRTIFFKGTNFSEEL